MTTYRERREARAERLHDWADSREKKADAAHAAAHQIADGIPFGQPILVGHHSEGRHRRDISRMENSMRASVDNARMAARHEERAGNIEAQLATSIYSDDADAVERLEERIAGLEAERARIKAYNALRRKRKSETEGIAEDLAAAGLAEADARGLLRSLEFQPYACKFGTFPAYTLQNLGGNITRQKNRLTQLRAQAASVTDDNPRGAGRRMYSRYGGTCPDCGSPFERGSVIVYYRVTREAVCAPCVDGVAVAS